MRRIAYLVMVISIVSAITSANATVQIGVDGVMNPPDVDMLVNETATLSIWTDSAMTGGDYFSGFLGVPEGQPGWIESEDELIILSGISIYPPLYPPPFPGFSSWVWFDFMPTEPVPPGVILIDNIIFHCNGLGNVDLTLLTTLDYSDWIYGDFQTIHQIPEPATLSLLGLGVLMLKRRG